MNRGNSRAPSLYNLAAATLIGCDSRPGSFLFPTERIRSYSFFEMWARNFDDPSSMAVPYVARCRVFVTSPLSFKLREMCFWDYLLFCLFSAVGCHGLGLLRPPFFFFYLLVTPAVPFLAIRRRHRPSSFWCTRRLPLISSSRSDALRLFAFCGRRLSLPRSFDVATLVTFPGLILFQPELRSVLVPMLCCLPVRQPFHADLALFP